MYFTSIQLVSLLCVFVCETLAISRLEAYNVNKTQVSVSGFSSGAAMASQLLVIYSSHFMGAGIIAGAPYGCAGGTYTGMISCTQTPSHESISHLEELVSNRASLGKVDPTSNLRHAKIYIYHGQNDSVINSGNGLKIQQLFSHFITDDNRIKAVFNISSEHTMPTDNFGGTCSKLQTTNFLNNCGYSAAYDLLNFIYGGHLRKPTRSTKAYGRLLTFDQSEFFASSAIFYSMDNIGYMYVPSGCVSRYGKCKLHVALHGCSMGREKINDTYVRHAGYNEVAELNNIIILYPQALTTLENTMGCWDWWGFSGANYATNRGYQPTAIKRMMDRIISRN